MRLIGMRLALLVTLLVASASDIPAPTIPVASAPAAVRLASAAVDRSRSDLGAEPSVGALSAWKRIRAVAVLGAATDSVTRRGSAVHAAGYAIPADHPRPPLGEFKLTAYSGPQLGQAKPITATGTAARAGRTVAVDPKVIPLGSRVYIEGLGERIAEDIGSAIRGRHIDVYVHTVPQAKTFGVKSRTVSLVALPDDQG